MAHAVLSPSAASRWLACTPSARLELQFPDQAGDYAKEGTLAHKFGESFLWQKLGTDVSDVLDIAREDEFYTPEMEAYAEDYAALVWEKYEIARKATPDAILLIEERIDLRAYVPDGFGTGDSVIIADDLLEIIDLKYGKGVAVSAKHNKQMMLYGLGALVKYSIMYGVNRVRMTIYQPRIGNVSEWEISAADLLEWAETELKPRAKMAFEGVGDFIPGEHCRFCRAKAVCKALAEQNLNVAKEEFKDVGVLTIEQVAEILPKLDGLVNWANAVEEYALDKALQGTKIPGYKIVEGRSVRKYADDKKVAERLEANGYGDIIYKPKELKTITTLEKALTKKGFEALVGDLIVKPAGKPTLVPVSDKRPEWSSAEEDFKNVSV